MRASAGYLLAILTLVNMINWADRQVVPVLFSGMRADLGLTDTQLGVVGGLAFSMIYAVAAFVFGRLADSGIRKNIITFGLVAWSLATMASGLADSFGSLVIARFFTGIGEASLYPCAMSLLAERIPLSSRGKAIGIFGAATAVGGGIGQGLGGFLSETMGWRTVFFAYGAVGLLAVPLTLSIPEKARTKAKDVADNFFGDILEIVRDTRLLAIWASGTVMIASGLGFAAWMPSLLERVHGFDQGQAALLAGGGTLLGGIVGSLIGGAIADKRRKLKLAGELDVSVVAALVTAPMILMVVWAESVPLLVVGGLIAPVALFSYFPSLSTLLMAIVPARKLGVAYAVQILFMGGIGSAFGPFLIGRLSDVTGSLELAISTTAAGCFTAAGLGWFAARHIRSVGIAPEDAPEDPRGVGPTGGAVFALGSANETRE